MIVEIYLKEYGYLDGVDDISVPLVLQIGDIQDISARKNTFSKTIQVPFTKNNNKIFSEAFEIKKIGGFNMTQKTGCIIYVDKNVIIDGYLILTKITYNTYGQNQLDGYYSCNVYDEIINIFDLFKDKSIKDLDFADEWEYESYKNGVQLIENYLSGDHVYNLTNVNNFFSNLGGKSFKYTDIVAYSIVNYNYNDLNYPNKNKFPYTGISLGELFPNVYLKAILDRMFYEANLKYDSAFFNDDISGTNIKGGLFSRLVNIYSAGIELTNKTLSYFSTPLSVNSTPIFKLNESSILSPPSPFTINELTKFNLPFQQNEKWTGVQFWSGGISGISYSFETYNSQYTTPIFNFPAIVIPEDGNYRIDFYLNVALDHGGCRNSTSSQYPITYPNSGYTSYELIIEPFNNTSGLTVSTSEENRYTYLSTDFGFKRGVMDATNYNYFGSDNLRNLELKKGDVCYMIVNRGVQIGTSGTTGIQIYSWLSNYHLNSAYIVLSKDIKNEDWVDQYNSTIKINETLPDISQADFLKNLIKMFNLYAFVDEKRPDLYHFKTHYEYYSGGTILNWDDKVCYDEQFEISGLLSKIKQKYDYKYEYDENFLTLQYKNENILEFGERDIIVDNYNKTSSKNENLYSSYICDQVKTKYLIDTPALGTINNHYNEFLMVPNFSTEKDSSIYQDLQPIKPAIGIVDKKTNYLRIFDSHNFYNITKVVEITPFSPKTLYYKTSNNTYSGSTDYYSLLYSDVDESIYISGVTNITQVDNLYDKYHKNQLLNIIDQEARELELYMNLTVKDISSFNFRNRVQIQGQNYFVQKINYDPTSPKPSKVLLLKETIPLQDMTIATSGGEIQE